jgi:hypothetical protein
MEVAADAGVGTNASPNRSPSAAAALISGPKPSSSSSPSRSDFCIVEAEVGIVDFNIGLPVRMGCDAGPAKVSMNDLDTSEMIEEARLEDFESLYHSIRVNQGWDILTGAGGTQEGKRGQRITYVSFFWISSHFLFRVPGSESSDGRAAVHADIGASGIDDGPGKFMPC